MNPRVKFADFIAVGALLLAAVAAAASLIVSGLYRDTPEMVREARAADLEGGDESKIGGSKWRIDRR